MKKKKILLLGGIVVDRYYEVDDYPARGRNAIVQHSFQKVGGSAINVAVTLQNLGALPYVVSKLGDDEAGRFVLRYLRSLSLPTECVAVEAKQKTGRCISILDKTGECTFFTLRGCEGEFSEDLVPGNLCEQISFSYITGYYLLRKTIASRVLRLMKKMKGVGCRIFFDPGPLVGSVDASQLSTMLALSDVVSPNQHELELIEQSLALPGHLHRWLHAQGCRYVVVKRGSAGVDVYTPEKHITAKAFQLHPVDASGAGDSFAGGMLYALAHSFELHKAIIFASACGAYTTTVKGPHAAFSIEDIDIVIQSQQGKMIFKGKREQQ